MKKTQVKIIERWDRADLEDDLNNFIKTVIVVDIKLVIGYINRPSVEDSGMFYTAMVVYTPLVSKT